MNRWGIVRHQLRTALTSLVAVVWTIPGLLGEPTPKTVPLRQVPRALLVEGLWSDHFRLREACHLAGFAYTTAYRSRSPFFRPMDQIIGLPASWEEFDLIVLSNVEAPVLGSNRLEALKVFVESGGGLVVLGGFCAFQHGAYWGTPLAELLPVIIGPSRLHRETEGLPLEAGSEGAWAKENFSARPRVYYLHEIRPRGAAELWLQAGGRPAVVSGLFGQGRVGVVGLTVNGEAAEGEIEFWEWAEWPRLLASLFSWAAPRARAIRHRDNNPRLNPAERIGVALGEVSADMVRRAMGALDGPTADAVFEHLFLPPERRHLSLSEAVPFLMPFAKTTWAPRLIEKSDAMNPDGEECRAALRLLGACRTAEGKAVLDRAFRDPALRDAAIQGYGWQGDASVVPDLRRLYETILGESKGGKVAGMLQPHSFAGGPVRTAVEAAMALYRLGDPGSVPRIAELFPQVHFLLRIYRNAAKRRVYPSDEQGLAFLEEIRVRVRILEEALRRMKEGAVPIPESQIHAMLEGAASETDPATVEWFLFAFESSAEHLPVEAWQRLASARDGILARLGRGE